MKAFSGTALARRRLLLRLSQDALAGQLDVTRQTISGWETGAFKPLVDQLPALADALKLGLIDDLFEELVEVVDQAGKGGTFSAGAA